MIASTSPSTSPPPPQVYRLRGLLGDVETTISLAEGEHRVGSSRQAEVCLPASGVSRRHARIRVLPDGLVVEDLGSTNGTWVDGERVERARIRARSELRFGPICLAVEAVPAADVELAIVLAPAAGEPRGGDSTPEGRTAVSTAVVDEVYPPRDAGRTSPPRELVFPRGYRPGTSPAMTALYVHMRPLLRNDLPVLIHGETGVGKEIVARILHASSDRRQGPWVAVNCAAIPAELLEAEMFGIASGVATGVEARAGKLRLADGGTLFLDEIGEMAPALQAKLLRALQEREVHPVGGAPRKVDVRVVSATNVDVERYLDEGSLRRDLYYRLAGFVLDVPPLRDARADVPGLVEHFLRRFCAEAGTAVRGLTVAALARLEGHHWPGNVRELEHEVRRLVYQLPPGGVITSAELSPRLAAAPRPDPVERLVDELDSLRLTPLFERLERRLLHEALRRSGGNKAEACRLLGLSRNGLHKKLKRLGGHGAESEGVGPAAGVPGRSEP